ncbi:MAG: hypothetical protein AAFQ82_18430, partial [Myxococcota bacterium]
MRLSDADIFQVWLRDPSVSDTDRSAALERMAEAAASQRMFDLRTLTGVNESRVSQLRNSAERFVRRQEEWPFQEHADLLGLTDRSLQFPEGFDVSSLPQPVLDSEQVFDSDATRIANIWMRTATDREIGEFFGRMGRLNHPITVDRMQQEAANWNPIQHDFSGSGWTRLSEDVEATSPEALEARRQAEAEEARVQEANETLVARAGELDAEPGLSERVNELLAQAGQPIPREGDGIHRVTVSSAPGVPARPAETDPDAVPRYPEGDEMRARMSALLDRMDTLDPGTRRADPVFQQLIEEAVGGNLSASQIAEVLDAAEARGAFDGTDAETRLARTRALLSAPHPDAVIEAFNGLSATDFEGPFPESVDPYQSVAQAVGPTVPFGGDAEAAAAAGLHSDLTPADQAGLVLDELASAQENGTDVYTRSDGESARDYFTELRGRNMDREVERNRAQQRAEVLQRAGAGLESSINETLDAISDPVAHSRAIDRIHGYLDSLERANYTTPGFDYDAPGVQPGDEYRARQFDPTSGTWSPIAENPL